MPRGVYDRTYKNDHFQAHKKFELEAGEQFCLIEGEPPKPKSKRPTGKLLRQFRNKFAALKSAALHPEQWYVWDRVNKCVVSSEKGI